MDYKVTRFIINGQTFVIPSASQTEKGLMSPDDFNKLMRLQDMAYRDVVSISDLDQNLYSTIQNKAASADVTALTNKVDTLLGSGDGSVSKTVTDAINNFATNVSDDGVVNSYKELIDWVAAHGGEATELAASLTGVQAILAGIGGTNQPATVMAAINNAISSLNIGNYATLGTSQSFTAAKTFTKGLVLPYNDGSWLSMATTTNQILGSKQNLANSAHSLFMLKNSTGSAISYGGLGAHIGFYGFKKERLDSSTNGTDWQTKWNVDTGDLEHSGQFTAGSIVKKNGTDTQILMADGSTIVGTDTFIKINGDNGTHEGVSALLNKLTAATGTPTDEDYYISQYAGGGTQYTTFHRRPVSVLWSYIKSKANGVYQPKGNYVTTDTAQTITANKTFSGNLTSSTGMIHGQAPETNAPHNHSIHLGHANNNHMDFYEYGGVWNFYKSVNGTDTLIASLTATGLTAPAFIKDEGKASQFLKADGSVDSNEYALSSALGDYLPLSGGTLTGKLTVPLFNITGEKYTIGCSPDTYFGPSIASTGALTCGRTDARWSNIFSVLGNFTGQITSSLATGTSPFKVTSTTVNTNLNADMLDGLHASNLYRIHAAGIWNDEENIVDWSKRVSSHLGLFTVNGWAWSSSAYLYLKGAPGDEVKDVITVDHQRYSVLSLKSGSMNNKWNQNCFMFIPTFKDSKMIYLAQLCNGDTTTATEVSIKRYADYDTILNGNVATATALQTARTLWGRSFDGSANISGDLSGVGNITASASMTVSAPSNLLTLNGGTGVYIKFNNDGAKSLVLNGTEFKPFNTSNGNLSLGSSTARWSNMYSILGNFSGQITSSLATGTSPFKVTSTTVNANLNADMLDGLHAHSFSQNFHHSSNGVYAKLGTLTIPQNGYAAMLRIVIGNGYNANVNQRRSGTLYVRTSNGNANASGFYADFFLEADYYNCIDLYFVQKSSTQYEIWTAKTAYTGSGFISLIANPSASLSFVSSTETASELPANATLITKKSRAFTDSNVATATTLQTSRTLWGQSFNGSGNVSGNMTGVGKITFNVGAGDRQLNIDTEGKINFKAGSGDWACGIRSYQTDNTTLLGYAAGSYGSGNTLTYHFYGGNYADPLMVLTPDGFLGIKTKNPKFRLDISSPALDKDFRIVGAMPSIVLESCASEYVNIYHKRDIGGDNERTLSYIKMENNNIETSPLTVKKNTGNYVAIKIDASGAPPCSKIAFSFNDIESAYIEHTGEQPGKGGFSFSDPIFAPKFFIPNGTNSQLLTASGEILNKWVLMTDWMHEADTEDEYIELILSSSVTNISTNVIQIIITPAQISNSLIGGNKLNYLREGMSQWFMFRAYKNGMATYFKLFVPASIWNMNGSTVFYRFDSNLCVNRVLYHVEGRYKMVYTGDNIQFTVQLDKTKCQNANMENAISAW